MQLAYQSILQDFGNLLLNTMDYHLLRGNPAYNEKGKPDIAKQKEIDKSIEKIVKNLTGFDMSKQRKKNLKEKVNWYSRLKSIIDKQNKKKSI